MKTKLTKIFLLIMIVYLFTINANLFSCSTFMFEKQGKLIFAHNLDQPGVKVPGYILINKRGVFKSGKTMSELLTKNRINSSNLSWISKYGSITFNVYGKDLIDGGMNEEGLYIWEMTNVLTENIKKESISKLFPANWMQYILDNYKDVDEVIKSISKVAPDGWSWHYFIADKKGNCASIDFLNGKAVIYKKKNMPVPGLFNRSYAHEIKRLEYFKGFGGEYKITLNNKSIPRVALAAKMLRDYKKEKNAVNYNYEILNAFGRGSTSQWSVVFDVMEQKVYFRTDVSTEIKSFSIKNMDYSNKTPVMFLDIDIKKGGDVIDKFSVLSDKNNLDLVKRIPFGALMKTSGGLILKEFNQRLATHYKSSYLAKNQYFKGSWTCDISVRNKLFRKYYPGLLQNDKLILEIKAENDKVSIFLSNAKGLFKKLPGNNISMHNNVLSVTFKFFTVILQIETKIIGNKMEGKLIIDGMDIEKLEFFKK